jgi:quercetin dioxygenase-like cupin family protein
MANCIAIRDPHIFILVCKAWRFGAFALKTYNSSLDERKAYMTDFPISVVDKNTGEWKEHPRFQGILLKSLLTKEDNALANVNVVQVPVGCAIGGHVHAAQVETIYVLAGQSVLTVDGVEAAFGAGQIVAVPVGVPHSLRNPGPELVELLTVFTPPL